MNPYLLGEGALGLIGRQGDEERTPGIGVKQEWDPELQQWRVQLDIVQSELAPIMAQLRDYQRITQGFAQEQFRLADEAKKNPWGHIAATIAGNMAAADPKLPGWVRGLGQASVQLNPSPEAMQQRGMHFAEAGYNAAEKGIALQERLSGMRANMAYRQAGLEAKKEADAARASAKTAELQQKGVEQTRKLIKDEVQDFDTYRTLLIKSGYSPEEADGMAMGAVNQAFENSKVREGKLKWEKEKEELGRLSREKIAASKDATDRARIAITKQREEWKQKIDRGEVIPKKDLMRYKVQLMKLKADVEQRGIKGLRDSIIGSQKMSTNFLGVSALDRTGEFKKDLETKLDQLAQTADAGIGSAQEILTAVEMELASIEGMLAGTPDKPVQNFPMAMGHRSVSTVPKMQYKPQDIGDPNIIGIEYTKPK